MNDAPPPSVANEAPNVNNPSASGEQVLQRIYCATVNHLRLRRRNQNFQAIRGYGYSVPYSPAYPPRQAYPSWPAYVPMDTIRAPMDTTPPQRRRPRITAMENILETKIDLNSHVAGPSRRYATHWFGGHPHTAMYRDCR